MSWQDVAKGLPQGAVLSPLLANLYLHSFDQYVTSRLKAYVRYADDFVIFTETKEEAERLSEGASAYLSGKLKLSVNSPRSEHVVEFSIFYDEKRNTDRYFFQRRQTSGLVFVF